MSCSNRVSQTLHEEYRTTIALTEGLGSLMRRHHRTILDISDDSVAQFIGHLGTTIETEINRHFDFEEHHLFSYLEAMSDTAIGTHLIEEHVAMPPLANWLPRRAARAPQIFIRPVGASSSV